MKERVTGRILQERLAAYDAQAVSQLSYSPVKTTPERSADEADGGPVTGKRGSPHRASLKYYSRWNRTMYP